MSKNKRIYAFLNTLTNSVLPLFFWVFLLFGFDKPYIAVLTIITALIHELGHGLAIKAVGCTADAPGGHLTGFRIRQRKYTDYKSEIIILAAGPVANILFFALCFIIPLPQRDYMHLFGFINLATALSNLMPVEGYDGYRILCELLSSRNMTRALSRLEKLSFLITVVLTFAALYLMDKTDSGYWLFGIFFVSMVSKIGKSISCSIFEE